MKNENENEKENDFRFPLLSSLTKDGKEEFN